jgi:hypothetical protein
MRRVRLDAFIACANPADRPFVWIKFTTRFAEQSFRNAGHPLVRRVRGVGGMQLLEERNDGRVRYFPSLPDQARFLASAPPQARREFHSAQRKGCSYLLRRAGCSCPGGLRPSHAAGFTVCAVERIAGNQAGSSHVTAKLIALLAPRDLVVLIGPALSENDLADPDRDVDAAMDHWIPSSAGLEMLGQAQRCLFKYVA